MSARIFAFFDPLIDLPFASLSALSSAFFGPAADFDDEDEEEEDEAGMSAGFANRIVERTGAKGYHVCDAVFMIRRALQAALLAAARNSVSRSRPSGKF